MEGEKKPTPNAVLLYEEGALFPVLQEEKGNPGRSGNLSKVSQVARRCQGNSEHWFSTPARRPVQ